MKKCRDYKIANNKTTAQLKLVSETDFLGTEQRPQRVNRSPQFRGYLIEEVMRRLRGTERVSFKGQETLHLTERPTWPLSPQLF
jgi:hypothetical protein